MHPFFTLTAVSPLHYAHLGNVQADADGFPGSPLSGASRRLSAHLRADEILICRPRVPTVMIPLSASRSRSQSPKGDSTASHSLQELLEMLASTRPQKVLLLSCMLNVVRLTPFVQWALLVRVN